MAKDHQLLTVATDYFQFATNFFEVINASATHIYHSALELSPLSSIVRKAYHSQRPYPLPHIVAGVQDSWGPSTAISTKHAYYLSSAWSPCGQFIAVVANEAVEIWDALTLKLLSTLKAVNAGARFKRGLSYSPDGHSLAGCSDTTIVIWDTQTGGEIKRIECGNTKDGLELVWSLDGKTIGAVLRKGSEVVTVTLYDVAFGTALPSYTFQTRGMSRIWAHGKYFRVTTTGLWDSTSYKLHIFEVGPTYTEIESFPFKHSSQIGGFSPTTHRVSTTTSTYSDVNQTPRLIILDICSSEVLLQETGSYRCLSFSPDGSLFAAFTGDQLHTWRYTSGHYTRWREFQQTPAQLQFSPTLSSILGCAGPLLFVLHLDNSPTTLLKKPLTTTKGQPLDAFSVDSTYIATAYHGERTITITNLDCQKPFPCQFIDTDFGISAMVLTGNVLLVKGLEKLIAWLLTEEGAASSIIGNTRADQNDSIWEVPIQAIFNRWRRLLRQSGESNDQGHLEFSVEDGVGAISLDQSVIHVYNTGTGEILEQDLHAQPTWYHFPDGCDFYYSNDCKHHIAPAQNWAMLETTWQEGWVRDSEGKHRLWMYSHWRSARNRVDWLHNATTLRIRSISELVIVEL